MNNMREKLDIVIPVYNEKECLQEMFARLLKLRDDMNFLDVNFIFVNDGSKDNSLEILYSYADKFDFVKVINFSRNFGHQMAITAGMDFADGDYVAVIDADLQDPPEVIQKMYEKSKEGFDVVYGKRLARQGESFFKKATAKLFYKFINLLCAIDIPKDTGDFRLITKRVLCSFKQLKEKHRFIRGMIPWVGFRSTPLYYDRDERFAGETKYPLNKMIKFALDAIFSFSNKPLKLANHLGILMILFGFGLGIYMLYMKLFTDLVVPGQTITILTIIIMSGIQVFMLGIIGEYIGRIFEESKDRPLYIIENTVNINHERSGKKNNEEFNTQTF